MSKTRPNGERERLTTCDHETFGRCAGTDMKHAYRSVSTSILSIPDCLASRLVRDRLVKVLFSATRMQARQGLASFA